MLIGTPPRSETNPALLTQQRLFSATQDTDALTLTYPAWVKPERTFWLATGRLTVSPKPGLPPESQIGTPTSYHPPLSKRLQAHSPHLHLHCNLPSAVPASLPGQKISPYPVTPTYTGRITASTSKLDRPTRSQDSHNPIQPLNSTAQSRISIKIKVWIVIQRCLHHLHQFLGFEERYQAHLSLHLRSSSPIQHPYTLRKHTFRPTRTQKMGLKVAFLFPPSFFHRFTYSFTLTYSHLRSAIHPHLHTYPPFKGGKCNSGARS